MELGQSTDQTNQDNKLPLVEEGGWVLHLGAGCIFFFFHFKFGSDVGVEGEQEGEGCHSKMMPCVHNLPLPGKRREGTRAVTVETDNNNNNNIQKSSGK